MIISDLMSNTRILKEIKSDSPLAFGQKASRFRNQSIIGCDGKLHTSIKWGRKYKWVKTTCSPKLSRCNQSQRELDLDRFNCINGTVIKEYGISTMKNIRKTMEDFNCLTERYDNNIPLVFFTICDGHSGYQTAKYVTKNIHESYLRDLKTYQGEEIFVNNAVFDGINNTFSQLDENILANQSFDSSGTTVVSILLLKDLKTSNIHMYAANVGDSRAVLSQNGIALRLTVDHTGSNAEEIKRIVDAGGLVWNGRINGSIMISRALGDKYLKKYLICNPHINHLIIQPSDDYIIIGSDGLWEAMSDQNAVDLVRENSHLSASDIAKLLKRTACLRSGDNITVIVIKL